MSVYRHGEKWRAAGWDRENGKGVHLGIFETEPEAKRAEARWYREVPPLGPPAVRNREDTALYRCFDAHGNLLYAGIASVVHLTDEAAPTDEAAA